jgi:hypothetical protein
MKNNLLVAFVWCGLLPAVHAAHPLVTDDTGTQDKGNSQIEVNADWTRQNGATTRTGTFTYSYGVLDNVDAFINLPATFTSPAGLNDASIGLKWRWMEAGPASFGLKSELLLPTGKQDRGLGNGRSSLALMLISSYDAAPWAFHANVGMTFNRYALQADRDANRNTLWRASMATSYAFNQQWKLVADTGIARNTDRTGSDHPAYLLTGAIYSPTKDLDIDFGVRYGIGCDQCPNGLDRQFGTGLTWRF